MHNKPHTEETKKKIRAAQAKWRETDDYKEFIKRQRARGKESKTKFKKGHKSYSDGSHLRGIQVGKKHWKWKGGRIKAFGYIFVLKPDHPNSSKRGYIQEHRLVMENHIGRYLDKNEIVHHINEDRSDNRIENLKIMSRAEHNRHHLRKRYAKKT